MSTQATADDRPTTEGRTVTASPAEAHVAVTGIVVFVIATFLHRVTDTVVPLLAVVLLHALSRARRGQHPGRTLATAAGVRVGLVASMTGPAR